MVQLTNQQIERVEKENARLLNLMDNATSQLIAKALDRLIEANNNLIKNGWSL